VRSERLRENLGKKHQGLRVAFPKPLIYWLRGLDLNQRPLGYERETAMTGNPLIWRETRWTTISFTLSVATSLLLLLRPVLGWSGSKMGARTWLPLTRRDDIERALFLSS
jgi:hypothetical protein